MKPGQRKVLYCCFKRNDKREVKVAQLAGSVAEMSAYHHGEVRLIFWDLMQNILIKLILGRLILVSNASYMKCF